MAAGLGMAPSGVSVGHRPQLRIGAVWVTLRVGRGNPVRRPREGKDLVGSAVWNRGVAPLLRRLQISQLRPPQHQCEIPLLSHGYRLRRSIHRWALFNTVESIMACLGGRKG